MMFHWCNTIFVYCSPARPWPKHKALSLWSRWWVTPPYLHVCSFSILILNNLNDFMPQRLFHNQWCHYSYWTYICPLIISADLLMLGKMGFFLIFLFNHNSHANTCNWLMFQEGFQIQTYLKNIQCTIH